MSNTDALRLRHEHEIDLSGKMPDLSNGYTIEAWVCPAPMDGAIRLYPQPNYGGKPVRLKEGLYRSMAGDYLPQLGSASLPEDIAAVFFSEADFQGESFAVRQDLPQAPAGQQQIGSVVVLDRSHRRQNHVVLFAQAGYQGKAQVLILPDFWQRPNENNTKEKTTDQKPGLTQVGSAWVPPGAALEVTQLRQSANPGSSFSLSLLAPNLTGDLPQDWPIKLQPSKSVDIPPNNILFLFEKPDYVGKSRVISGKQSDLSSPPWPVRSAIYVQAPDSVEGVIGIGPKTENSSEREVQLLPVGTRMPSDSVRWHFWVPPNFRLVPVENEDIPDRIGNGLQECHGSTSYIVKRASESQQRKDVSRVAEGIQRVERQPDQPKTRQGQAIYRLADGPWAKFSGLGQTWLQDVPDFSILNIPKRRALFLFRKPIAAVTAVDDYEVLTDGIFDLRALGWKPQAAIFMDAPHGTEGVLSLSHHGQIIPVERVVRSNINRSIWAPPGFELIREQREWGPGFHEHIAAFGHSVAQAVHSTLRGDLSQLPDGVTRIEPRRDAPLAGTELIFTTQQEPFRQQTLAPQINDPRAALPAFKSVRVPQGSVLRLYPNHGQGGTPVNLTGSHDDLSDLPWTPRSLAFGEAPYGEDGIIYTARGRRAAVAPNGYQIGKKLNGEWHYYGPGYVAIEEPEASLVVSSYHAEPQPIVPAASERGAAGSQAATARIGIVAVKGGTTGLTIIRQPSELRGAGDELRFGGMLLRPDRWYHLALTWDGTTLCQILDGRQVQQADHSEKDANAAGSWVLGAGFRGAVAQVRVWNSARTLAQIRDDRYPSTTPAEAPALDLFAQGFDAWQAPPDAVVVSADLPDAPADSVLVRQMQQQVEVEHHQNMQAARKAAAAQSALARKQAQRTVALARQQARRDIHIRGIKRLGFVLGGAERIGGLDSITEHYYPTNLRTTDLILGPDDSWYISLDGGLWHIRNQNNATDAPDLPSPPRALTCDFSGNHTKAKREGKAWVGLYWIEADGAICRAWIPPGESKHDERQQLFGFFVPLGRSGYWDIALDPEKQILYWTNGWELYWSNVAADEPKTFQVLLPHVASPFPIALAVAPDGSLLWLDAEDEVARMLPQDRIEKALGAVKTLYPAPRPSRGLAVSRLADTNNSGQEAAFVYWVAAERRTLEVPVLDTPGRYIDLYHDLKHPHWHGQHVEMVAVNEFAGVQWTAASLGMTPDQVQGQGGDANSKVLSFGAGQSSDPLAAGQSAQLPGPDDVLTFEPTRFNLQQGWTVSAELIWEGTGSDPKMPICLYELATDEDEERIVCLIEPDEADSQTGIPTLHLRWNGHVLTGEHRVLSDRRLRINELHRVTWMLARSGLVSTFVDGEKVVEEQISLPAGATVFESHSLGAPNSAQTHQEVAGALVNRDDPQRVFAGFHGRIARFAAWNCTVPQAANGWEHTPDPDPTWARSLVTVESTRRYLHAGRLDGKEPPVTLFPIEMDGGLNIETVLDQAHAELTLAHAQKAAVEEQAAHLKAVALQNAHAQLDAATQNLADAQAQSAADVSAAQAQANRDQADARSRKADADARAERDRVQGKQDADQARADGQQQAETMETRAADAKRNRIADANRRRSDAQSRLDDARR
ncbi:LamG-like jellyroll fold domain-containing protein [Candidatus Amarolinea dominans]|uniref:LamG-like jellyroll fold domain-containing protein n=1 Tax=Candidatus Amarolinea dominans TaxID=3140696 RepID=UPI0031376189|nr:hypothetical protein [Anaerolineae bacterium]